MHNPVSLLRQGIYSADWIKEFYDQANIWWGPDPQDLGVHTARVNTVHRLCGPEPMQILELGAGSGHTAAALADAGHSIMSVELSPRRAAIAQQLADLPHRGSMTVLEADFFDVDLPGKYDLICCWEVFGLVTDTDQRRLLKRMSQEWLTTDGCVLMDVYNPYKPAREAGKEWRLGALDGVPGSVEMIERCHFDPLQSRWIDEWIPVAMPEKALAQAIRCYAPADFSLLLGGTGLTLRRIEVDGIQLDIFSERIATSSPLLETWSYFVQLIPENPGPA
jgi:SAM-dependent methyltransferase